MLVVTDYEKTISYNKITRRLHDNKYRLIFNKLVNKYKSETTLKVVDVGSGPCQYFLRLKKQFPKLEYFAIEPTMHFYNSALRNYGDIAGFSIENAYAQEVLPNIKNIDVILSFDSLEHMPLNIRNKVLEQVSQINFKDFFVNVPNEIGPAIVIKNYGSWFMRYIRHKEYTHAETWLAAFYKLDCLPRHIDAHKGFDWRNLYTNLRFYFNTAIYTSPFQLMPRSFSPSIFFHCTPRI